MPGRAWWPFQARGEAGQAGFNPLEISLPLRAWESQAQLARMKRRPWESWGLRPHPVTVSCKLRLTAKSETFYGRDPTRVHNLVPLTQELWATLNKAADPSLRVHI